MTRSQFFQKLGIGAVICSVFKKEATKDKVFYRKGKLIGITDSDIDNLNVRGTMQADELEGEKIKHIGMGNVYTSHLGIYLPVEVYIKLRQSGMIR